MSRLKSCTSYGVEADACLRTVAARSRSCLYQGISYLQVLMVLVKIADARRAQRRFDEIRVDISARLWSVNSGMSSESYNDLIDGMALTQLESEQRFISHATRMTSKS